MNDDPCVIDANAVTFYDDDDYATVCASALGDVFAEAPLSIVLDDERSLWTLIHSTHGRSSSSAFYREAGENPLHPPRILEVLLNK